MADTFNPSGAPPATPRECALCHKTNPAYQCPGCGVRYCCGTCYKRHLAESECKGQHTMA
ncbi:hypothetical protein KIPB_016500, partial [Kipferlia bialata]|eukprot:g16500.t1